MEHSHVMGGSTAARRINCPGSLEAEKAVPDEQTSEFAQRGSMLHAAMEMLLTADPETMDDARPLLDELLGQDLGFKTDEFPDMVITDDLLATKLVPALEAWFTVHERYDLDDWFIEQRVSLEEIVPGAFGTADLLAIDTQKRFHVLDWKFGDGVVVDVENNLGLMFYAGAALYDPDEELQEFTEDISGVVLHIVQPRVGSRDVLSSWETTVDAIEDVVDLAETAMQKAALENAPRAPGSWCGFCKGRAECPEQNRLAVDALSVTPERMDAVSLAKAMTLAKQLDGWIAAVNKLALQEMEGGAQIPGFKLVNKRPRRVWTDEAAAEKAMRAGKLKVSEIFKKSLISPTQAEKLNKALYSKTLSDMVAMHSTGLTIAPDSDKRQAVTSGAELLAQALPEQ